MANQEIIDLTTDLYKIYGRLRKISHEDLKDESYGRFLNQAKQGVGDASLRIEAIAQAEIREDVDLYLDFQEKIYELKQKEVFNI